MKNGKKKKKKLTVNGLARLGLDQTTMENGTTPAHLHGDYRDYRWLKGKFKVHMTH